MEFRVAPLPRILRVCRFASSRFRESCFNGRSDDESRFLELCILWREPADESSCQPVRALSGLTLDARSISLGPSLPEIPFANCRLQLVCASSCQVRAFKSDSQTRCTVSAHLVYGPDTLCGLLAPFMETWMIDTGQARTVLPNTTFLGVRFAGRSRGRPG
jgi:hypothetical protein